MILTLHCDGDGFATDRWMTAVVVQWYLLSTVTVTVLPATAGWPLLSSNDTYSPRWRWWFCNRPLDDRCCRLMILTFHSDGDGFATDRWMAAVVVLWYLLSTVTVMVLPPTAGWPLLSSNDTYSPRWRWWFCHRLLDDRCCRPIWDRARTLRRRDESTWCPLPLHQLYWGEKGKDLTQSREKNS